MTTGKKLSLLAIAIFVLSTTNASASVFTASATGELTGRGLTTQEFTFNGGTLKCTSAESSGIIESVESSDLHFTTKYGKCTFAGFTAEVSPATWTVTATGTVHLQNTVTIKVSVLACHLTINPQSVNLVNFTNLSGRLQLLFQLAQIVYTSAGLCGSSGSNGTHVGKHELERVGGGSISWDA